MVTLETLATHEAAHAAVATALGVPIGSVSLTPESGEHGGITRGGAEADRRRLFRAVGFHEFAEREAKVLLAGRLAETKEFGTHATGASDERGARGIAMLLCHSEGEEKELLARLAAETSALLDRIWPATEAIAKALLDERHLEGDDLREIWEAHSIVQGKAP
jgi:ATP-dependent Zn protease